MRDACDQPLTLADIRLQAAGCGLHMAPACEAAVLSGAQQLQAAVQRLLQLEQQLEQQQAALEPRA